MGVETGRKNGENKAIEKDDDYFPSLSESFSVTLNDTEVSDSNPPVSVDGCAECPNCEGSVNTVDDHVKRLVDENGEEVLAICPLGAGGNSEGCGKKIYNCTPEEEAVHDAWHMERTCTNDSWFSLGNLIEKEGPCEEKFRHCTQSDCGYRYRWGRGHSDGSISEAPAGVTNAYADSHNLETPPDEGMVAANCCPIHLRQAYIQ